MAAAIETKPTRPNEIGMHASPSRSTTSTKPSRQPRGTTAILRGIATYQDIYKLTYVRGPSSIIVMLAEELTKD